MITAVEIEGKAVAALVAAPGRARDLEAARDALARLDFLHAAAILFARAQCDEVIWGEIVAEVVPRLTDSKTAIMLIALADTNRLRLVLDLLHRNALGNDASGTQLRALAIVVAVTMPDPANERTASVRAVLATHARVTLLDCLNTREVVGLSMLAAIEPHLGDAFVSEALLSEPVGKLLANASELARNTVSRFMGHMERVFAASKAELRPLTAAYQVESPSAVIAARSPSAVRRAQIVANSTLARNFEARGVGRNELCPCGSGKKYKRCHGGADVDSLPLPLSPGASPGLSRELGVPRDILELQELSPVEIARLPLTALDEPTLVGALDRFIDAGGWTHAERVVEESTRRTAFRADFAQQCRLRLAVAALDARRFDLVEKHLREVPEALASYGRLVVEAAAAISQNAPDATGKLTRILDLALKDPTGNIAINLAGLLRKIEPALAMVILRACVPLDELSEALPLLEYAGVRLGMYEREIARTYLDTVARLRQDTEEHKRRATAALSEADGLRAALADAQHLAREQKRALDELQAELARERSAGVLATVPVEPHEVRALRAKVEDLQVMVRERNAELAALRDSLVAEPQAAATSSPVVVSEPAADAEEEWEADDHDGDHRLRVPAWTPGAVAALYSVPSHVGREALRTVAELAAGDRNAWRCVKRPKGSRLPLLMSRIGIHHRLLVRVEPDEIAALELVSRGSLMLTLKKYTRTG